MSGRRLTQTHFSLAGFLVVLILAWFCYQPALTGAFQLDDTSNLAGLATVTDRDSAWQFILSNEAGPTGRPIALATFALQAAAWQDGAEAFLRVNVLIHLLNSVLLAGCFYLFALQYQRDRVQAVTIAVVAASLWVLMPLLASASLQVVQRMTTLSGTFALLGLGGYLIARTRLDSAPRAALVGMSASLALGTVLATLTKEMGLLLPIYVLVLEATVLQRPSHLATRAWRSWQAVFLLLPAVIVIAYLASRFNYPEWTVARRGFTGWERLLTETRLLWIYLGKAVVGLPATLGLYQSPPAISRSLFEPATLVASLSWLALAVTAIVRRRRWPLFAMAVLWYLVGHMLESTWLSLEPYFEHRNYLPVAGPLFAGVAFLLTGSVMRRRAALVALSAYALLSAFFLFTYASMSGEPSVTSRFWAVRYPDSVRAVTNMATWQLAEEGPLRTLATIDRFVTEQPGHGYLRIQELNLRCLVMPAEDHEGVVAQLRDTLPGVEFTYTAGTMLSQLFSTVVGRDCSGVGVATVAELARALQRNPRYALVPGYNQFHHKLLAGIARQSGDDDATLAHLEEAIAHRPSSELNMMVVTTLAGAGDFVAANAFIERAFGQAPFHPLRARVWRSDLENLREYVSRLERHAEETETNDE